MSFTDHLEELRACLIRAAFGWLAATVVAMVFAKDILAFIIKPALIVLYAQGEKPELMAISPAGPFMLYLKVGFLTGLIVSMPWLLYQIWVFVSTGLYLHERRFVKRLLPILAALFALGVTFMYYVVLPLAMNFFVMFSQGFDLPELRLNWFQRIVLGQNNPTPSNLEPAFDLVVPVVDVDPDQPAEGMVWINNRQRTLNARLPDGTYNTTLRPAANSRSVSNLYSVQDIISFVFALALGFGIAFELPVFVVALSAMSMVTAADMARSRKYVLFGIVIVSAILTPPDVLSQILLAVPTYLLFEAGLLVAKALERNRMATGA